GTEGDQVMNWNRLLADSGRGESASRTQNMPLVPVPVKSRCPDSIGFAQIFFGDCQGGRLCQAEGLGRRTSLFPVRIPRQGLRQNPPIHVELGQDEFELVSVRVIPQQLHLRQSLNSCLQV